jgi:peptidoglycan/LPS O-acetylase OafA/YrhL
VAPFLLRRGPGLVALVGLLSLGLRGVLASNGFSQDPWTNRFFPSELGLFCIGALGSHFYLTKLRGRKVSRKITGGATIGVIALTLFYPFTPFKAYWPENAWPYYAVVALTLPFIFKFSANSKLDRVLGDLSYPIYLTHFLVLRLMTSGAGMAEDSKLPEVIFATLLAAFGLLALTRPFERLRGKTIEKLHVPRKSRIKGP